MHICQLIISLFLSPTLRATATHRASLLAYHITKRMVNMNRPQPQVSLPNATNENYITISRTPKLTLTLVGCNKINA